MGYSNAVAQKQNGERGDSFSGANAQRKMVAVPVLQPVAEKLPVQGVFVAQIKALEKEISVQKNPYSSNISEKVNAGINNHSGEFIRIKNFQYNTSETEIRQCQLISKTPENKNVAQLTYDVLTNTWHGKPKSPTTGPVKQARDQAKITVPLLPGQPGHTANHKYSSASIIDDIMSGFDPNKDNATQLRILQNCASFGGITLPNAIIHELQTPYAQRTPAFKQAVETFVNQVVWTPWNIFFSEDCNKRDDDLHDGSALDQHFTASGAATPRSSVSRDIKLNQGLSHIDPGLLTSRLLELQQNGQTNSSALALADWTHNAARTHGRFNQLGDPANWTTPFSEIIYPKNGERIQSDSYTLRIKANHNTQRVFVKIQFVGTDGNWLPARSGDPGVWWFDWHNIPQGSFELMAKSLNNLNNEFVSHHVRVTH